MATYLLAWSSRRWPWDDLPELSDAVGAGKRTSIRWSCGPSKRLRRGDRVFLIRLGHEPKGIFASGAISKGSYEDKHWDEDESAAGKTCFFVKVQLDTLLDPNTDRILPRESLNTGIFSKMHWDTQMSGVSIPDKVAEELERVWADFANQANFWLPEEVEKNDAIYEGALRRIYVNAYERNPDARRKCIAHYGSSCMACGFDFARLYGKIGKNFIHVHHLRQLALIGREYKVDPIRDLRPVCPNCHAIIHRRRPAYTIEEVQALLRQAKSEKEA